MPSNYTANRQPGVLRSLDWWTIGIYIALLTFGWVSVCGASYTYGDTEIFSLSTRSGMQIVWIGTSICLGFVLLMMDDRFYDTFAYVIYGLLVLLLLPQSLILTVLKVHVHGLCLVHSDFNLPSLLSSQRHWQLPSSCLLTALQLRIGSISQVLVESSSYRCYVL